MGCTIQTLVSVALLLLLEAWSAFHHRLGSFIESQSSNLIVFAACIIYFI